MEEILASIRRIISEDEAASSKDRAPTGPTRPATDASPGKGSAPTRRPDSAATERRPSGNGSGNGLGNGQAGAYDATDPYSVTDSIPGAASDREAAQNGTHQGGAAHHYDSDETAADYGSGAFVDDDDAVLDLTEMVAEDGSVVTIAPLSAADDGEVYDDEVAYDDQGGYDDTLYAEPSGDGAAYDDDEGAYDEAGTGAYAAGEERGDGATLILPDDDQETGHASDLVGEAPPSPRGNGHDRTHRAEHEDYAPEDYIDPDRNDDGAATQPRRRRITGSVLTQGPIEAETSPDPRTVPVTRSAARRNNALAALAGDEVRDDDPDLGPDTGPVSGQAGDEPLASPTERRAATISATAIAVPAAPKPSETGAGGEVAPRAAPPAPAAAADDAAAVTREAAASLLEGSALEDMVREAMKPMLREWLDNNLARLVEDVARQELSKMIERRGGL